MAHRGRCGAATHPGLTCAKCALERLRHAARAGCRGASADTRKLRTGRCGIRFGTQPYLSAANNSRLKVSSQPNAAPVADIRCAPADARELSHRSVWETLHDRKRLLGSETQTLLPRPRQKLAHAIPPSSPVLRGLQPIPPLAACALTIGREDVNRAKHAL